MMDGAMTRRCDFEVQEAAMFSGVINRIVAPMTFNRCSDAHRKGSLAGRKDSQFLTLFYPTKLKDMEHNVLILAWLTLINDATQCASDVCYQADVCASDCL